MRKVIYTALIGNYDDIPSICDTDKWNCVLYTDLEVPNNKKSNWTIKKVNSGLAKTPNLLNRWYKLHPHILFPDCEFSIYVDSNIIIKDFKKINLEIQKLISEEVQLAAPKHFSRNDIYEESEAVIRSEKENFLKVLKTVRYLRNNSYKPDSGLYENNIIFRRHNDQKVVNLMNEWWYFINNYSRRDQLSLMYLLQKWGVKHKKLFNKRENHRNSDFIEFKIEHKSVKRKNSNLLVKIKKRIYIKLLRIYDKYLIKYC